MKQLVDALLYLKSKNIAHGRVRC